MFWELSREKVGKKVKKEAAQKRKKKGACLFSGGNFVASKKRTSKERLRKGMRSRLKRNQPFLAIRKKRPRPALQRTAVEGTGWNQLKGKFVVRLAKPVVTELAFWEKGGGGEG